MMNHSVVHSMTISWLRILMSSLGWGAITALGVEIFQSIQDSPDLTAQSALYIGSSAAAVTFIINAVIAARIGPKC